MATIQQAINAAKIKPSNRSSYEQGLVDGNKGDQRVRNADFEAKRQERIYGPD